MIGSIARYDRLVATLDQLTGDAVKVAVYLAHAPILLDPAGWLTLTAAWLKSASKILWLRPEVIRNCMEELVRVGVIDRIGRNRFAGKTVSSAESMSDPPGNLARSESPDRTSTDLNFDSPTSRPPWEDEEKTEMRGTEPARSAGSSGLRDNGELFSEHGGGSNTPPPKASPSGIDPIAQPHRFVVDAVHRMYVDRYGTKPTWGAKPAALIAALLKQHKAEEIVRRARIMFYEDRKFPKGPYSVLALSTHFDLFSVSKKPGGGPADRDRSKSGPGYYGEVTDV